MKNTASLPLVLAFALSVLMLSLSAEAATTKYWDVNGSTPGSGQGTGSQTWNTTGLLWTTDPTGSSPVTTFNTGDIAVFSAGTDATNAFTINLTSAVTAGGLTIEEGSVSLTGAAVTNGTGTITIDSGAKLSIPGSSTINATSGAQFVLNGGTMENTNVGLGGSFVSPAIVIVLNGGGTLSYTGPNTGLSIIQTGSPGTSISGSGPLTKVGGGVLAIATTNNSWTGGTIINNGELRIRTSSNTLPTNTAVTINSPGILNLNSLSQTIGSLTGNGTVGLGNGTLTVGTDNTDTVFSGTIVDLSSTNSGGVTSGSGKLMKTGGGTLMLAGASTYTGATTVNQGTLALTNGGSLGATTVTVLSGATLANKTTNTATLGGAVTFNSGALALFTAAGGGSSVVGKISLNGSSKNLTLNSNAITVNVTGAALAAGSYRLMDCTGTLSGSANPVATITGTPLTNGYIANVIATTGASTTGHLDLLVNPPPANITGITNLADGTKQIGFAGAASQNYLIQAATNLAPPVSWTNISTNLSGTNGFFLFIDTDATNFPLRFYRTSTP